MDNEIAKRKLNSARKNLENSIQVLGWDEDGSESFLFLQTKNLLRAYLQFKKEAENYKFKITKKNPPFVQEHYSFEEDAKIILQSLEENRYLTQTRASSGIDGLMNIVEEYYKEVKEKYGDLHDKKGNETNLREIITTIQEIRDFSAYPNHVCRLDGEYLAW